jgi:hypothetical protein
MKILTFLLIHTIAASVANASYDVNYITVNKKPTIEIIINNKVCHFPQEKIRDITKADAKQLVELCLHSK